MVRQIRFASLVLVVLLGGFAGSLRGQQKPQWLPGQVGLNAGVLPSPGISYVNMTLRYGTDRFNGPSGNAILTNVISGNLTVWANENIFYWVADTKILGGNPGFALGITPASGTLTADILPNLTSLTASAGGSGLSDTYVQPFSLGWHLKRADIQAMEAVIVPTGRYNPGATNNVGTGYFGNHVQTGTTVYITKNRGTSANLFTDWEVHGGRQGTNNTSKTPGQAFTDEWGLGQVLPIKKNMSQLLQVGGVGYDQWQVTANTGTIPIPGTSLITAANPIPFYSVHAAGVAVNYILPAKHIVGFFKYYHEYKAYSHYQGDTLVFGGTWTFLIPRPVAPPKK
jgi:hypothetical protein